VGADSGRFVISKHIYGQFSEHLGRGIYGGLWVGEDSPVPNVKGVRLDIIEALRHIRVPNLRWPGGCFADEYHWMDGIGPRAERPRMVNTHWGGVVEDNSFGTHEFLELCELLGAEPYICGNVGSGTVEEMSKWVEYITFGGDSPMARLRASHGRENPWRVRLWGVGNENWGCGGNMTAETYAAMYRRYATYCRDYGENRLLKIAGGPNVDDFHWMEVMMREIPLHLLGGVSLHNYTFTRAWADKGRATGFTEDDYFSLLEHGLRMDGLIARHAAIMDRYDPAKRVALVVDEWGAWYNAERGTNPAFLYQQNTLRDALLAGMILNVFHKHCDRVRVANIAQLVNVLQALFLTRGEQMLLTPTYYVFDMYKVHQEATMLPVEVSCPGYGRLGREIPAVSASASRDRDGRVHVSLVNVDPGRAIEVSCPVRGFDRGNHATGTIITAPGMDARNTFEEPSAVTLQPFAGFSFEGGLLRVTLPPKSVVTVELDTRYSAAALVPEPAPNPWPDDYTGVSAMKEYKRWGTYNVHDPACILVGDTYYAYSTDAIFRMDSAAVKQAGLPFGYVPIRRSKDLVHWEFVGWAFRSIPAEATAWVKQQNMGWGASNVWAPYVVRYKNKFRMYYCVSAFGRQTSYIGLAEAASPEGPWQPKGCVVKTKTGDVMNAIDPSVVVNPENGETWLHYGSFFGGLHVVQLNPATGLTLRANDQGHLVARRFDGKKNNIEAPEVIYHPGLKKYFLFVSYDPLMTTYNVRVGRSDTPQGPFVDYFGHDMADERDDFPVLTYPYQFENHPGWAGTGHCAVFGDAKGNFFMAHQSRLSPMNQLMVLTVREIKWTADGWPVVSPERYAATPGAAIAGEQLAGEWEVIVLTGQVPERPLEAGQVVRNEVFLRQNERVSSKRIILHADGSMTGAWEGTWSFEAGTLRVRHGETALSLAVWPGQDWENEKKTVLFSGLNASGCSVWGKKRK
jgi:alpha-N-arabinofuranosidase